MTTYNRATLKTGFCQYDVKHKDIETNLKTIRRLLKGCGADVMVLPELAFTGYHFTSREELAAFASVHVQEKIVSELQALAAKEAMLIVAGMAEAFEGRLYNSAFLVDGSGLIGKHRKIHLTDNESIFDAGDVLDVFALDGLKIGVSICFETWFPEAFRVLADKGADLVVSPSNFGGPWTTDVVKVRALENTMPVVMCNRVGSEVIDGETERFRGTSRIVDHIGDVVAEAGRDESVHTVVIDVETPERNRSLISGRMLSERKKYERLT